MAVSETEELLPATRRALLGRVARGQAEGRAPSLVGAVVRDGGQVWCGSRAMIEDHEPDGDVQYRIGSLTKTFVAVLIMRLRAEGLLDLSDPVGKYLDPGEVGSATIAQLLSHTAGLTAESRGPWWERTPGDLRPSLGDIFGDRPRPLPAGRQFHYSNPGFALLGALAGHLRGHGWDEAVRREILVPLGMTRTTLQAQAPHAGGFAVHPWADVMQPEPAERTGHMAPAGDLWSTADDLSRFGAFLLDGDDRVLPVATLEEMRAPAAPPSTSLGGYGLGLQIVQREGRTLFGHGGSMPGFLATLWVSPDDGLGAVTLSNTTAGPAIGEIAADLIDIVAASEPRLPARWKPQPGIGPELIALTGLWYWGPRATVLRVLSPQMLELAPVSGAGRGARFRASGHGTWTGLDGYYAGETLRLVPAADGVAEHLDLGTFVFTREPYGPGSPTAARPHQDGWQGAW
ncbi:MAG TPA: serine hydrolase domain-containing protein [Trebonia sp.]|nr:serine hydrolase domain-containing protein [Trebonia sp.]